MRAPSPLRRSPRPLPVALALTAAMTLAACGGTQAPADDAPPGADDQAGPEVEEVEGIEEVEEEQPLRVLASFYALQWAVEQVGGDLVEVSPITPPGVDPHDLELSPRQVRDFGEVEAVVYLSGFQPAVDEAVDARQPAAVLDVLDAADLREVEDDHGHLDDDHGHDDHAHDDHGHEDDDHGHEGEGDDHAHGIHGNLDPHFWLDPHRMAAVGHEIARLLAEAAPEHEETFTENALSLEEDMSDLDRAYADGLARCERDVVITGHAAFGYLADRYGFTELGIAGIDPDTEPSPARLREIGEIAERYDVATIFADDPVNPAVAATLADNLGIDVGLLDPIESQADEDQDYREVMESNLEQLRQGLGCA